MNPWIGIFSVLGSLGLLLGGCRYASQRFSLSAELSRKIVHMGMGILCTVFPLLFAQTWPVLLLAGVAVVSLLVVRTLPGLRTTIGASLHGVTRSSLGELLFPVAVAAVWYISPENPLYYSLSVLVLTLADAFAALVGTKYGLRHYTTAEGHKSWEGSFTFFSAAFLCIHVPLLLLTTIGRAECLLIALLIAILVMLVEAVAWRGLDNLFIPLCVCILLNVYDSFSAWQILIRIFFILCIIIALFIVRSRSRLDDAAILGASLVAYLSVTAGGWQWVIAPLVLFINYLFLGPLKKSAAERVHTIHATLSVTLPGLFWLLLFYRHQSPELFFCYNLAYMAELTCIFIAQWAFEFQEKSLTKIMTKASLLAFAMIMIPYFLVTYRQLRILDLLFALIAALLSGLLFRFLQPQIRDCPLNLPRYLRQGGIGFAISSLPFVFSLLLR